LLKKQLKDPNYLWWSLREKEEVLYLELDLISALSSSVVKYIEWAVITFQETIFTVMLWGTPS
jgi:hypothetical protein